MGRQGRQIRIRPGLRQPVPGQFLRKGKHPVIIDAEAAAAFIRGYSQIMADIFGPVPEGGKMPLVDVVAGGRGKYIEDRALLETALAALARRSIDVPRDVAAAVRGLDVKQWVFLKDTRRHSVFIDPKGHAAYAVLGLTDRIRELIGGSGAIIETGLMRYRGRYVCDGIVTGVVWLGANYKRAFAELLAELKVRRAFYTSGD
jgi:hypothetical protein